jgi:4-amino-4-deoxy-L-arabinose transferase-like glycosyltransferase
MRGGGQPGHQVHSASGRWNVATLRRKRLRPQRRNSWSIAAPGAWETQFPVLRQADHRGRTAAHLSTGPHIYTIENRRANAAGASLTAAREQSRGATDDTTANGRMRLHMRAPRYTLRLDQRSNGCGARDASKRRGQH